METNEVLASPITAAELPVQSEPVDEEKESLKAKIVELEKKEVELQKQKEHWREKYERDITSATPAPSENEEVFSDEGKALRGEIKSLGEKLSLIEKKEQRREVEAEYPILKDRKSEFDEFLEDDENKRLSLKKAAKLFLAENQLTPEVPQRKGLEKPTGGGGTPPSSGISDEEAERIRTTDYKKYEKLLREGKIK